MEEVEDLIYYSQNTQNTEDLEITSFESPKQEQRQQSRFASSRSSSNSNSNNQNGRRLLENFKSLKSRHDSRTRLFAHDYRSGKYADSTSLVLVIRRILKPITRVNKLMDVLAFDLKENKDRRILFKPQDKYDFKEGVFLNLYPPWQEVSIPGTSETVTVIIAAHFYKIIHKPDETLVKRYNEIYNLALPKPIYMRLPEPPFNDLVPNQIKNQNTVPKQIERFKSYLNLDVLIVNVWDQTSPGLCLLKDYDDFYTLLEIPKCDILANLLVGNHIRLTNIAIGEMLHVSKNLAPFSILYHFGAKKQTYFYVVRWVKESQSESISLDISMPELTDETITIEDMRLIDKRQDIRISLCCKVKEKGDDYMLLEDEWESSLRVQIVLESSRLGQTSQIKGNMSILIKFLRLISGRTIWDLFTTWEEVPDNSVSETFESD